MNEVFQESEVQMKHAVDHLHRELRTLRTGRATVAMLDGVTVDYYGSPMSLNQVATLSAPEPTMLVIQPFDASQIAAIEKGIQLAGLDLNPSNDGKLVRLPVPSLTEERRKEIVRRAHDMAEEARVGVRGARRDGNDTLKKMEKEKEISQDDEHRGLDEIQKLHDHYIAEINKALKSKEEQILTL